MRPPCEIVQRDFLRAVRTFVARGLSERGYSQTDIASQMDLTQAAVSKYLSQPIAKTRLAGEIDVLTQKLIKLITSGDADADTLVREICSSCMHSRVGSTLCEMHQRKVPSLKAANCQICAQLLGGRDTELSKRAIIIGDVLDALRVLEASESFVDVVPQIRANIVSCDDTAKSIKDVAGVPGRITVIDGRARALVSPQFGASSHTSELLLKAKELWTGVRSCLYISGRASVVTIAKKIGFRVVELTESESTSMKIIGALESSKKIPGPRTVYPAIHAPGGFGVEPILYVFGPTPKALSEKCVKLSESLPG
ncbi:MAG: thiamine-phosphate synthase family protein [Candidatus Thorarchaeota archaeon]